MALLPVGAHADTWIADPSAPSSFGDGLNWSLGVVPGPTSSAQINNGGTAEIGPGESYSVSRIDIGTSTTGNRLEQSGGSITSTGPLMIGNGSGAGGTYTIIDSSVTVGGTGSSDNTSIGRTGGTGELTISGTSKLTVTDGEFFVGQATGSHGTLTLNDSAEISAINWIAIGRGGGTGVATLNGSSKLHTTGGGFVVGAPVGGVSSGTLSINDEAEAFYTGGNAMYIGEASNGTVTVSGSGKYYSTSSGIWVGQGSGGNGVLNLTGNATSTAGNETYIGNDGGTGALNLSGSASFSTASSKLVISRTNGVGSVLVEDDAVISIGGGEIDVAENNTGSLTIRGNGQVIASGTNMNIHIGSAPFTDSAQAPGNGTTTIDGGRLAAPNGVVILGYQPTGTGTLNVNGGAISANGIYKGSGTMAPGTATINFNGGTVQAVSPNSDYFARFDSADLHLQEGGLKFDPNGNEVTITQDLSGDGGFSLVGSGHITLSGLNSYLGGTTIDGGQLTIIAAYLADNANVTIENGGVFELNYFGGDTIGALIVDGVPLALGTWGSSVSGAEHVNDILFSGTGYLVVTSLVPEPSTLALILGGLGIAGLRLRRNRRRTRES